ncbi:adenosylcobinamide-GDP ribazoletransferase [Virgibacillus soli]
MKSYLYGLVMTVQFFSMLPINKEVPMTAKNMERAIRVFPLFGLFIGCIYSGFAYVLLQWTPLSPLASSFFLWLLIIVLTGGIHLDGWIDASDAFFSYRDPEKRLEIMKDPRVGAFGVLSVIVLLATKFIFIYEMISQVSPSTFVFILFIPFFSRTLMGMILVLVPSAKKDGLGYMFQKACRPKSVYFYLFYIVPVLITVGIWNEKVLIIVMIMLISVIILFFFIRRKAVKWFTGITGDVVGAATEGVEVFLWMIVWLLLCYVMG